MKQQHSGFPIAVAVVFAAAFAPPTHAIDITAGDWKLSISGNVNAHFIYEICQSRPRIVSGGLACIANDNSSSVSNGLLPAALSVSGATTQGGYDIAFTFGLYPGISTNDGGSPNLQATTGPNGALVPLQHTHVGLGTTGLDVRQVFLTFGNDRMGTVMAGRNIGLFQADAILNDMTLLGVGAGTPLYAAPPNTSLGSIGLGYIYTDWFAQINYTTPDLFGTKVTVGVFDPFNTLGQPLPTNKKVPGIHAKVAYKAGPLYLSASGLFQEQRGTLASSATTSIGDYNSWAFDAGGKFDFDAFFPGLEVLGWYYRAKGVGTTGLFFNSNDAFGNTRDSEGFLAQVTYKIGPMKFGVNYGYSKLYQSGLELRRALGATLVSNNSKITGGFYYDLTQNLTLLAEYSYVVAENQAKAENKSDNVNVGAFLKF
jgi:predicted porin